MKDGDTIIAEGQTDALYRAARKQGALEFADRIGFAVSANMDCEGSAREVMQHVLNHLQLLRAEIEGEK